MLLDYGDGLGGVMANFYHHLDYMWDQLNAKFWAHYLGLSHSDYLKSEDPS